MVKRKLSTKEVMDKYGAKIEAQMNSEAMKSSTNYSQEYLKFKDEIAPEFSGYEKWAHSLGKSIKIKASKKDEAKLKKAIDIAHLDIEPSQALSLSIMSFISVFFFGLLLSVGIAFAKGGIEEFPALLFFLFVIFSIFLFYFVNSYPERLANKWRLKASSQMVPAILYVVVYMRHTPNLEKAIAFAAKNLKYPLAMDFKKVFYDVEIGKFSTIKESLDSYLETWRDYSIEFIEAFHLIESSLFESAEGKRIATLEKSLQVVLDGVYEKMLKFTHNVRSPLTNVYMLGVVLPTLGLALIPLASSMLDGKIKGVHIFVLFNLVVPFLVFFLTDKILMMRPGGHGETNLLKRNPLYAKYKSNSHFVRAFFLCLPLLIIGLIPLIFQFTPLPAALGIPSDVTFSQLGLPIDAIGEEHVFGFVNVGTNEERDIRGPFGLGSMILGLFIPLSFALFFSIAYSNKTKKLIKERTKTKQLEAEFNNSLFQLGNRLGNGTPPELVFGRVAQSSKGLMTGDFFRRVNYNIQQMGMSVEKAIFDKNRGALRVYPSETIATSMRVLVESSKKGLKIAAVSLMSISEYIKNIGKITIRLKDMLAEISSDMKSNMTFLAPLLSGIVVGLAAMISMILSRLDIAAMSAGAEGVADIGSFGTLFNHLSMVPPFYLQIFVGIYLIQIVFILTKTLVVVDSGEDELEKTNKIASNLKKGIGLFFVTAFLSILVLSILAVTVI
jgi:Flp pilus assembly protein TadB